MLRVLEPGDYFGTNHERYGGDRLSVVETCFADDLDEFFFVVEGRFFIDLEQRVVELGPGQAFVVPKGVLHRPHSPAKTVILMVEGEAIVPTGDA